MAPTSSSEPADDPRSLPRLAAALRGGGVTLGTSSLLLASEALAQIDLGRRSDVRACLRSTLIHDPADFELFDHLFDALFPSDVNLPRDSTPLLPKSPHAPPSPAMKRLAQALLAAGSVKTLERKISDERDSRGTASDIDLLKRKDFEQMSAREIDAARELLRTVFPEESLRRSRRFVPAALGPQLDLRRMLRSALSGGELRPRRRQVDLRPRDWVLLVDVSGSMATYSRMFLQFAHALRRRSRGLEVFTFSTRLTRISRALRPVDPDIALQAVTGAVSDWDGGTRIGDSLAEFNRVWSRRVLARGAFVLLLTDGLERGAPDVLEVEMRRLARRARELVWINPLLRSASYQPLAAGAAVLDRHATLRRSAHNVESLLDLGRLLDTRRLSQNS
jgi:hypothetical protein